MCWFRYCSNRRQLPQKARIDVRPILPPQNTHTKRKNSKFFFFFLSGGGGGGRLLVVAVLVVEVGVVIVVVVVVNFLGRPLGFMVIQEITFTKYMRFKNSKNQNYIRMLEQKGQGKATIVMRFHSPVLRVSTDSRSYCLQFLGEEMMREEKVCLNDE